MWVFCAGGKSLSKVSFTVAPVLRPFPQAGGSVLSLQEHAPFLTPISSRPLPNHTASIRMLLNFLQTFGHPTTKVVTTDCCFSTSKFAAAVTSPVFISLCTYNFLKKLFLDLFILFSVYDYFACRRVQHYIFLISKGIRKYQTFSLELQ